MVAFVTWGASEFPCLLGGVPRFTVMGEAKYVRLFVFSLSCAWCDLGLTSRAEALRFIDIPLVTGPSVVALEQSAKPKVPRLRLY